MKPKQTQHSTDPMEEAYKQLSSPSGTAVSDAAKGIPPQNQAEEAETANDAKAERLGVAPGEGQEDPATCDVHDIDNAYAMLFESLAVILKSK